MKTNISYSRSLCLLGMLSFVVTGCQSNSNKYDITPIDLGLPSGRQWAECNLGASSAEEAGDYFFWGDTQPCKHGSRYKYVTDNFYDGGGESKYLKYVNDSELGDVDSKAILDKQDDAASVMLGDTWVIPSVADIEELLTCCTWVEMTKNGVDGMLCTGPNGNSLFFPDLGHHADVFGILIMPGTWYWTNSLSMDSWFDDRFAYAMSINHTSEGTKIELDSEYRTSGAFIRPVKH